MRIKHECVVQATEVFSRATIGRRFFATAVQLSSDENTRAILFIATLTIFNIIKSCETIAQKQPSELSKIVLLAILPLSSGGPNR
jgi:hypothetical protein